MPRFVNAIFIGPAAHDALEQGATGKVHSIFKRIFNVLINGKLVGIARGGVARSPINVITDIPPSKNISSLGLRKGMQVRRIGDQILVGNVLEISLKSVELWQPRTRVGGCIDLELVGRNLELAKQLTVGKGGKEGMGQLVLHVNEIAYGVMPHVSDSNQVVEAALPHIVNLAKSVRAGNVRGVQQSAQKLIGLGPGLTPSADDALAGFMVARWWVINSLGEALDHVRGMNEAIIGQMGGTTLISQQLLEHAASGETNEAVEKLLESILVGKASDVKAGVESVLNIGETSGIDTVVGILVGFNFSLSMYIQAILLLTRLS